MSPEQMTEEQRKQLEEKIKNMSPEELAEFQRQQCIFCQIISGKIPSKKIYEDEKSIAILDINPATKGHLLLLPKEHYAIMPQIPDKDLRHFFSVAKKLSQVLLRALKVSGTNVFVANGLAAGQRSQHFIIHLIPRKEGDGLLNFSEKIISKKEQQAVIATVENKILELLNAKKQVIRKKEEDEEDHAEQKEEDEEIEIPIEKVPQHLLTAVKEKIPHFEIKEVELEKRDEEDIYELEGTVDGVEYEVEVTVDKKGKVIDIKVEKEDEEIEEELDADEQANEQEDDQKQEENVSLDDIANLFK